MECERQRIQDTASVSEHEELDQAPYVISVKLVNLAEPRVISKPGALRKPKHAVHLSDRNKYGYFPGSGLRSHQKCLRTLQVSVRVRVIVQRLRAKSCRNMTATRAGQVPVSWSIRLHARDFTQIDSFVTGQAQYLAEQ